LEFCLSAALQPGGVLAFTLQASTEAEFQLGADQRFSHNQGYVTAVVRAAGLNLTSLTRSSFRQERKLDVPGLLIVATKPA
jgi:predicted TPR repeat methyltransferase